MLYTADVHVYDIAGNVHLTMSVVDWEKGNPEDRRTTVLERSITFPGVGEDDPTHWLLTALWSLIEDL